MRKELVEVRYDTVRGRISSASWVLVDVEGKDSGSIRPEVLGSVRDGGIEVWLDADTLAHGIAQAMPLIRKRLGEAS